MPELGYIKTACFQLKIVNNCKGTIERHQIEDASVVNEVMQRCYILSVDNVTHSLRLKPAQSFCRKFGNNKSMVINTSSWKTLSKWLNEWFECKEGPASVMHDNQSVEAKLERYRVEELDQIEWDFGDKSDAISDKIYYPTRVWTKTTFKKDKKIIQI